MASPDLKRRPLLVTGVPRSGTTWLSRMLAHAPGTALPGREPMNPRGNQFALGGTVTAWARLREPSRAQARVLRRCYSGLDPRVTSKFGVRQWAAPWPGTRVVVKDPFAVLSISGIVGVTGALPVLVYRDPAAVLASYQRMGWQADTAEMQALGMPVRRDGDEVLAMADFWTFIHEVALADLAETGTGVVVSHEELVRGGSAAMARLFDACGLSWTDGVRRALGEDSDASTGSHTGRTAAGAADPSRGQVAVAAAAAPAEAAGVEGAAGTAASERTLHVFDRSRDAVADGWRARMHPHDIDTMHRATDRMWQALEAVKLSVLGNESR